MLSLLVLLACADKPIARDDGWMWIAGDVNLGAGATGALGSLDFSGAGVVNLEGAIGPALDPPLLFNHPEALAELSAVGVKVVGVANDHVADAPNEVEKILRPAGLLPAGPKGAAVLTIDGKRVVITAHHLPSATLADDLALARKQGDVLVATFHSETDAPLPDALAVATAAGVDIVAAHGTHTSGALTGHPHAWALGDLAFAHGGAQTGLVLRVRPSDLKIEVVPMTVGRDGAPARRAE